jgi:ArsR family transcriptional regulator, cadmium/lead-responsive transcriptional repressor
MTATGSLSARFAVSERPIACLRWCGFVQTRREHRTAHDRIADERVLGLIVLAKELLAGNEEHVAACRRA